MKITGRYARNIAASIAALFMACLVCGGSRSEDLGNELKRQARQEQFYFDPLPDQGKDFDDSLRIYLDSSKNAYKAGQQLVITAYLKNESKKTRFFKRLWSPSGSEGSKFTFLFDNQESWGQGIFKKEVIGGESPDPEKALKLDPGEKAPIVKITFTRLVEGSHTLSAQYGANYTVAEKKSRNWWQGYARSNTIALKVTRDLPSKEINKSLASVIKAIHKDILGLKQDYPEMSGYTDSALNTPKGAYAGAPVIGYSKPKPAKFRISIYFNKPSYSPPTLATLSNGFPFLETMLFAHIDVDNPSLRGDLINIVNRRGLALNDVMRKYESYLAVDVQPFEDFVLDQFSRAQIIALGTVKKVEVETDKPYEYTLKKWVLSVDVKESFLGKLDTKKIKVKSGTLNTTFGSEKVVGKDYVFLMLKKQAWQNEYSLVGAQMPRENLTSWLRKKFAGKNK